MDQSELVKSGQLIIKSLDDAGVRPRTAAWIESAETGRWKLIIVPHQSIKDQREFYRQIAEIVSKHREELGDIDAADTEMAKPEDPIPMAMRVLIRMEGLGNASFESSVFNNLRLPHAIVMRST